MLLTLQLSRHLMRWQCNMRLALKTEASVSFWWAHFHYVFKPPAAISILSVAFSVIYSERNLAKSPYLSGIQFFGRGTLPPSMTFLIGLNVFVCHFLCQIWLSLLCICQKPHRFADKLRIASLLESLFCSASFATFCYFIQKVIKRWCLVNVDGNVKFQFSSLLCVIFSLPLQIPLVASLNILGYY